MDSIPARCRDENGYLVRQSLMTEVPYGRRTVARAGCGFLAVYNTARFFGLPVRESEVWQYFHQGVFLGAVMGTTIGHLCRGVYRFGMRITGVRYRDLKNAPAGNVERVLICMPFLLPCCTHTPRPFMLSPASRLCRASHTRQTASVPARSRECTIWREREAR